MSEGHNERRRTRMVNRPVQLRLIMTMSLIPALGLSVTMIIVCIFCYNLYEEATQLDVFLENLIPLFLAVFSFVAVAVVFILSNAYRVSHQIAGPTFSLCRSLQQIREGDLAFRAKLRSQDQLLEIRDELNLLLDTLNENPPPGFRTREMLNQEVEQRLEQERLEQERLVQAPEPAAPLIDHDVSVEPADLATTIETSE